MRQGNPFRAPLAGQRPAPLVGAGIEFAESHRLRGAVERDDGDGRIVAALFGELRAVWSPNGIPSSNGLGVSSAAAGLIAPLLLIASLCIVTGASHADTGPEQCLERPVRHAGHQAQREFLGAQRQPDQRLGVPIEHADIGLVAEAQGSEQLVGRCAAPVVPCRRP